MKEEEVRQEEKEEECCCHEHHHRHHGHGRKHYVRGGADAVYGLGFIGACIYYFSIAPTFWVGVLGLLKSIVWPVFLVLEAFKALGL